MKKMVMVAAVLFSVLGPSTNAEDMSNEINKISRALMEYGHNATLVAAVKKQNTEELTLAEIQFRDKIWRKTRGINDLMKSLLENDAAKTLMSIEKSHPHLFELFLMDNQGANVAMTNKTTDYWQGDEAKWKASFKDGKGALHISDVELYDESAHAFLVQVSVPVMDDGKAIGAITFGINIDELKY